MTVREAGGASSGAAATRRRSSRGSLPEGHAARAIAAVVDTFGLLALCAQIALCDDVAGSPAIDPATLLTLWAFYARHVVGDVENRRQVKLCREQGRAIARRRR